MKHNWEYKQLGDICDKGSSNLMQKNLEIIDNGFEVFGASGSLGKIDFYQQEAPYVGIVKDGSGVGRCNLYPAKSSLLGTMQYIIAKNCVSNEYLCYLMQSLNLSKYVNGAAIPHIYFRDYKKEIVPVPPMEVQERIVAELDKINETIEDCRELLRNLDALAQSLFYDFFGDPVTNPKGWEIKKLDEICRAISTGITYKPDNVADIGTIVLRSSNIQNSSFVLDDIVHIDMSLKPSQYVQKNDILMCSRNGSARLVGKVALIPQLNEKMSWGAFMTIIRSDYYHYLFQFFRLPAFREQLTKTKTTTVNQITIGMLKKIQIPMPPLSLQEQFASRIEQIEAQKKAVEETIENLQTLLDSRMDYWFN